MAPKRMENSVGVDKGKRRFWCRVGPWVKNGLAIGFLGLVLWLLIDHAQDVAWREIQQVLRGYSWFHLLVGIFFSLATCAVYASYDLFGRYYLRHRLSKVKTLGIAFVCCAFTLNLGAMIGSVGFRYRLYSQHGVGKGDITRIIGIVISTNWLGYIAVAGVAFVSGSVDVPFTWAISDLGLRLLGALFLGVVLAYFALCALAKRRSWVIKGQRFTLPGVKVAATQLLVSSIHWLLMAGIMFTFLYGEVDYLPLLGVLLISAIAGIITHIPGALGVLEAVFILLLGSKVSSVKLFAALIAYRAVFYLLPLAVGAIMYLLLEVTVKKKGMESSSR